MSQFLLRFWGVRGSIPTPGERTVRVGGNTSCVEVRAGDRLVVLDGGTGLAGLGKTLDLKKGLEMDFLFSHLHWDHIQGFPFFGPLYVPGVCMRVHGNTRFAETFEEAFTSQMGGPFYPVPFGALPSDAEFVAIEGESSVDLAARVTVKARELDHPGGVLAYRIEHEGRSLVYATDHEHFSHPDPALLDFARDADVLIYDAQYTEDEYFGRVGMHKVGWGHSTWQEGVKVAKGAGVGHLVLFHHDPDHDDDFIDRLEAEAREHFPRTTAAREGFEVDLLREPG